MTELILTKPERMRMHEDQQIAAEYKAMREAYPSASFMRIVASIAASGKFQPKSTAGVRSALIRAGVHTPVRKNA